MFRPVYKVKNLKYSIEKVESLFGRFLMGLEYLVNQSGPVTMGASQVCGFVKSDPSEATLIYNFMFRLLYRHLGCNSNATLKELLQLLQILDLQAEVK